MKRMWLGLLVVSAILLAVVLFPRVNLHLSPSLQNGGIINIIEGDGNETHNTVISDNEGQDKWTTKEIVEVIIGICGVVIAIIQLLPKRGGGKQG